MTLAQTIAQTLLPASSTIVTALTLRPVRPPSKYFLDRCLATPQDIVGLTLHSDVTGYLQVDTVEPSDDAWYVVVCHSAEGPRLELAASHPISDLNDDAYAWLVQPIVLPDGLLPHPDDQ